MAVRYRKYQNNNQKSQTYGKWYARAVVIDDITTKQLAEEIAHSTTVTYADVMAVLIETSEKLRDHLLNSHKVRLDGIGSFKVGLKTQPATTAAEFGANNVSGYRIVYAPETTFIASGTNEAGNRTGTRQKNLLRGITVREVPKNAVED